MFSNCSQILFRQLINNSAGVPHLLKATFCPTFGILLEQFILCLLGGDEASTCFHHLCEEPSMVPTLGCHFIILLYIFENYKHQIRFWEIYIYGNCKYKYNLTPFLLWRG